MQNNLIGHLYKLNSNKIGNSIHFRLILDKSKCDETVYNVLLIGGNITSTIVNYMLEPNYGFVKIITKLDSNGEK
jgi:hypothetical protein